MKKTGRRIVINDTRLPGATRLFRKGVCCFMAEINSFKSKVFGGFDRKDVVSYIERLAGERNDYIVKCRELETALTEKDAETEELKQKFEAEKAELLDAFREEKEKLVEEYEAKLTEADAALICANIKAEDDLKTERDISIRAVNELSERFSAAKADTDLICAHLLEDLDAAQKKIARLSEALVNSEERLKELRDTLGE